MGDFYEMLKRHCYARFTIECRMKITTHDIQNEQYYAYIIWKLFAVAKHIKYTHIKYAHKNNNKEKIYFMNHSRRTALKCDRRKYYHWQGGEEKRSIHKKKFIISPFFSPQIFSINFWNYVMTSFHLCKVLKNKGSDRSSNIREKIATRGKRNFSFLSF